MFNNELDNYIMMLKLTNIQLMTGRHYKVKGIASYSYIHDKNFLINISRERIAIGCLGDIRSRLRNNINNNINNKIQTFTKNIFPDNIEVYFDDSLMCFIIKNTPSRLYEQLVNIDDKLENICKYIYSIEYETSCK